MFQFLKCMLYFLSTEEVSGLGKDD